MIEDDDLADEFLRSLDVSSRTRKSYYYDLKHYFDWCEANEVDPIKATERQLGLYARACRMSGLAETTIRRRMSSIAALFKWLVTAGHRLGTIDISQFSVRPPTVTNLRDTPTLDELRSMWRAAANARERALLGLLTFNSMTTEEICSANIDDLGVVDGVAVLRIPSRSRERGYGLAVLSIDVHAAISANLGGRRSGPLFLGQQGDRITGRVVIRLARRLGVRAGVGFAVKPLSLTYSLRAIAVERGFSYLGVMRAVGSRDHRRHMAIMRAATNPVTENASIRLSRLVVAREASPSDRLRQAELILSDTDAPPAAALGLVGATLERHLREMVHAAKYPVDRSAEKATLGTYLQILRKHHVISNAEHKLLQSIGHHRDNAAHGWFERVTVQDVHRVVKQVEAFINEHPLIDSNEPGEAATAP